jgi:pyruvate carboxylase
MHASSTHHIHQPFRTLSTLFVYGTLRRSYGHPLHDLLSNQFQFIGRGSVHGELFDIGNYPGIIVSKKVKSRVLGEVYRARDKSTIVSILKILDDYEGYDESHPVDCEYVRKRKMVKLGNGKKCLCWLYEYNKPISNKASIAGGDYIRYITKKIRH